MPGELSQEYVVARRALLDALDALGPQRVAVVLVGAQAIYVHTGDAGLAVAEYTTDADIAVDPFKLVEDPTLAAAMRAAGFFREESEDGPLVGIWSSLRQISGVSAVVKVDLLIPAALGEGGRRAARIEGQEPGSVLKVLGLEGCLVDCEPKTIAAFEADDSRSFGIMVAGPASLLVSKVIKLQEREAGASRGRDRRKNKDALDVLRLLRAVEVHELAAGLNLLRADELSAEVAEIAVRALPELFGRANSSASLMAADAVSPAESAEVIAASCAALVGELLEAIDAAAGDA
ncbi:MAG: GSU2403 family nucleotidyltransferase fold protein [Coriobacteriia bacterium]|nr:GSU2403 family nucleotidyltransferase fold protein [Coriobacteriia bacterium]